MTTFSLAIHGGAGTILKKNLTIEIETNYLNALDRAIEVGYSILENGGSSLDAVEKAVIALEDNPLFNAGKGSVFTENEQHEMDAAIMDGFQKKAGAVALVTGVKNPISLARLVMEKSGVVFLAGQGAVAFAKQNNCRFESENYFYDAFRHHQWMEVKNSGAIQLDHTPSEDKKFGTVGAVALDKYGNVAAATSTGGLTNKKQGRIGDSPIIGVGTYANNSTCAVSCTGSGEFFMRGVVAYDVSCLMEYKGLSLKEACDEVIHSRLIQLGGLGGLIGVDSLGNIALSFNTEGMYRGYKSSNGNTYKGIYT